MEHNNHKNAVIMYRLLTSVSTMVYKNETILAIDLTELLPVLDLRYIIIDPDGKEHEITEVKLIDGRIYELDKNQLSIHSVDIDGVLGQEEWF